MSDDQLHDEPAAYGAVNPRSEFAQMIESLYREEVIEARKMSPDDKLILGERLFRWACAVTLEGIRLQHPDASEEDCQRMLRDRIELGRRLEALE